MSMGKSNRMAKGRLQESARFILSIRTALKKTQKALAADLGVSTIAVSDWERGQYPPSAESWAKLGNLVPDYIVAAECWKRASVDRDRMLRVSELLLKERGTSISGVRGISLSDFWLDGNVVRPAAGLNFLCLRYCEGAPLVVTACNLGFDLYRWWMPLPKPPKEGE